MFGNALAKIKEMSAKAGAQLTKVDDLERVCLAAAGAMFADGTCEDKEYDAAKGVISDRFQGVFNDRQIDTALQKATRTMEGGKYSGRRAVFQAMTKVESSEEGEAIFCVAMDVAASAGDISDEEKPYLKELAAKLRVSNTAAYGL